MKVYIEHEGTKEYLYTSLDRTFTIVEDIKSAHFIVTGKYDDTKYNSSLKGIIIPYTGHNGIDLEALRAKKLELYVTPTRSKYVAEKALNLTLSLLGNTVFYHNMLKKGNWSSRNSEKRIPWVTLQGKRVGFYGFGRIGKRIYKLMSGFNCVCYTIDRDKPYPRDVNLVEDIDQLIQNSDIIIISTPLNKTTEGIFNANRFSKMSDKFLVNVGRGKICDEKALYEALKNENLRGYASDVWYTYPKGKEDMYPSNYPIYDLDNVILSNHSGGYTVNTNKEVNEDLLVLLNKLQNNNNEDKLDTTNLL